MSREVRRVPIDWRHPVELNPYWRGQQLSRFRRGEGPFRLHREDERFVGLMRTTLGEAQREWDAGKAAWESLDESHRDVAWELDYYVRGYTGADGDWHDPTPLTVYADDGDTVLWEGLVSDGAELVRRKPWEVDNGDRPTSGYMPDFDVPEDQLGWCLYETVSEGTPVTPVLETADELIEYLIQAGEDWSQKPYRREAAERLVRSGSSFGSFVSLGDGQVLDGARDADRIEEVLGDRT